MTTVSWPPRLQMWLPVYTGRGMNRITMIKPFVTDGSFEILIQPTGVVYNCGLLGLGCLMKISLVCPMEDEKSDHSIAWLPCEGRDNKTVNGMGC